MKIERTFTEAGKDAYASIEFTTTSSEIRNPDGTVVFKLDDIEVPASWSQVASDVIAQKYFRKKGVPAGTRVQFPQANADSDGPPDAHLAARRSLQFLSEDTCASPSWSADSSPTALSGTDSTRRGGCQ